MHQTHETTIPARHQTNIFIIARSTNNIPHKCMEDRQNNTNTKTKQRQKYRHFLQINLTIVTSSQTLPNIIHKKFSEQKYYTYTALNINTQTHQQGFKKNNTLRQHCTQQTTTFLYLCFGKCLQ